MNQKKNIAYSMEQLPEFIVDQLASGILPTFLPVSFVCEQNQYTGVYNTEHFRPLSAVKEISTYELLQVFRELLGILAENEKHYVFGETYSLSTDTVYVDTLCAKVKLIFKPLERLCTTKEQLVTLLHTCKSKISAEGACYVDDVCAFLQREDTGFTSIIHHVEQLQNEVYACDIL